MFIEKEKVYKRIEKLWNKSQKGNTYPNQEEKMIQEYYDMLSSIEKEIKEKDEPKE